MKTDTINHCHDFRWRGSVYKLVWRELAAYLMLYFALNLAYRFAFTEAQQKYVIHIYKR